MQLYITNIKKENSIPMISHNIDDSLFDRMIVIHVNMVSFYSGNTKGSGIEEAVAAAGQVIEGVNRRPHTMATNTLSSAFRKLDIDQYNEDLFVDESGGESAEAVQALGPDEAEVNALLNGYPFLCTHK